MRIIERFTRIPDRIDYRFTVDDPKTWARSFTAEGPFENGTAGSDFRQPVTRGIAA
jgi:hypothetical protein